MNWHQVAFESVASTAWRNGGGTTRELLAWPHRHDWRVRVSLANVARSGPFSAYPGVSRWFAVVEGEGVKLDVAGVAHALDARSAPLGFDGGLDVHCELAAGETLDFNLMLQGASGQLERVRGRNEKTCRKGALVGVYSHEHEVDFLAVEVRIVVPPRTLAWQVLPADGRIIFTSEAALWFEVQP